MKGVKVNLPSILFNYLSDSVIETMTIETGKSKKSYISLQKLISDIQREREALLII